MTNELLLNKLLDAHETGATSMLLMMEDVTDLIDTIQDSTRLAFIVKNWGMDLEEVRLLTDMGIETMNPDKRQL